jgi:hypothetical protein
MLSLSLHDQSPTLKPRTILEFMLQKVCTFGQTELNNFRYC